ncbi:DUF5518 domain-containing protein [Halorarius litoreus]|uniref:DUF5518 domain-containing protein n=1 Tax=Halorarius litoreus TaxID=2962676 RepID=UPI0020CD8C9C|nr:DUF5518 domain-containing protein [Halorarius litoreus]
MSRTVSPGRSLPDTWRYALVGGLVSIPFTAASYLETGSELSLSAVLVGGFLAGYLAECRTGTSTGVGVRAGVVGALPALWLLVDMLETVGSLSNPLWFSAALVALALAVTGLAFVLGGLGGELGAMVGSWAAGTRRSHTSQ